MGTIFTKNNVFDPLDNPFELETGIRYALCKASIYQISDYLGYMKHIFVDYNANDPKLIDDFVNDLKRYRSRMEYLLDSIRNGTHTSKDEICNKIDIMDYKLQLLTQEYEKKGLKRNPTSWFIKPGKIGSYIIIPPKCQKIYRPRKYIIRKIGDTSYQIPNILAEGAYGVVFDVCDNLDKCNYVMKVQLIEFEDQVTDFKKELDYSTIFSKKKVSPRLYDGWLCTEIIDEIQFTVGILVYEKWDGELLVNDVLSKKMLAKWKRMIKVIHKAGYVHADLYPKNILVKRDDDGEVVDMVITDFGLSGNIESFKGDNVEWTDRLCMQLAEWDIGIGLPNIKKIFYNMTNTDNMKDACVALTIDPPLLDWIVYRYYVKYKSI